MTDLVTAHLTRTSVRSLAWVLETDAELVDPPSVAFLAPGTEPDEGTAWTPAAWAGADEVGPDGHHRHTLTLLVGGPDSGAAVTLPAGELVSWVRISTSTETLEEPGSLVEVR